MDETKLTPLELPGWLEFNAWKTGATPHRFEHVASGVELRAVFYLDKRGRIVQPVANPYLPVTFTSLRQGEASRTSQWLEAAGLLAEDMRRRGSAAPFCLTSDVSDVRPWSWRGFSASPRYTYLIEAPFDDRMVKKTRRHQIRKAISSGMTVERVTDVEPVMTCLEDTAARQGFDVPVTAEELRTAVSLVGEDKVRCYVGFDSKGRPASATIALHSPGQRSMIWQGGTVEANLRNGADALVSMEMIRDLFTAGAGGIDFCGANIPSVAAFKSSFGATLVTTYCLSTYSMRMAYRFITEWRRSVARRRMRAT